ncbi:hypothetical protein PsorP6_010370 [Peronosclerospora sorghi]|uniref:Uncharacterized protein n=1 Tax=Peronosclerospora sorghi TaxID=230839 RepID=A0ACC0VUA9_9STRA|nr:hypothetical protein PsorP6_010370 [Peronosclerospora sorghi]
METHRFRVRPFRKLKLRARDRALLLEITDAIVLDKLEQYEAHVHRGKQQVDLRRWKKMMTKSGPTLSYLERRSSNPASQVSELAHGRSLDDNMFGIVNPTIEAMRNQDVVPKGCSCGGGLSHSDGAKRGGPVSIRGRQDGWKLIFPSLPSASYGIGTMCTLNVRGSCCSNTAVEWVTISYIP